MGDTGWVVPSANTVDAGSGTWTNDSNLRVDDGSEATFSLTSKNTTGRANRGQTFGFDALIPSGATITVVEIRAEWRVNSTAGIGNLELQAFVSGSGVGSARSNSAEPTTLTTNSYDITADRTWTRANLLDGTFELRTWGRNGNSTSDPSYRWDHIAARVQYTLDATPSPGAIALSATVPSPTLSYGSTPAPAATALAATVPAVTAPAGSTTAPAVIPLSATLPAPTPSGGGGGGFSPSDLADLAFWLDAAAIEGLNDGDSVGTWADESGNGRDATQSTGSLKPTYQTNELNGKPIVRFDGSDDVLAVPTAAISGASEIEVYILVKIAADPPASGAQVGLWALGGEGTEGTLFPWTDGNIHDSFGSSVRRSVGNPSTSLTQWNIYNVVCSPFHFVARLNGTQLTEQFSPTVDTDEATPLLGANSEGAYLNGDIAEVIIYHAELSEADRGDVEDYLIDKWLTAGADGTATPAATALAATVPAATTAAGAVPTPAATALAVTQPGPTLSAGSTPTPAATALAATLPAPTASAGSTPTPAATALAVTQPAPTLSAGSTPTPAAIPLAATAPAASASGGGSATASPDVIARTVTLPAPTPSASSTPTPAASALAVTLPAATVTGAGNASPGVIAVVVAQPAPTPAAASTVLASVVALVTALPAATVSGAGLASPGAIVTTIALPVVEAQGAAVPDPNPYEVTVREVQALVFTDLSTAAAYIESVDAAHRERSTVTHREAP